MYDIFMMKPVTIYFNELTYQLFQQFAAQQNRKAAELIREAMEEYIVRQTKSPSLGSWSPVSLGGMRSSAADWISKDYQSEILGASYDRN